MFVVVAYDIVSDSRRNRVVNFLKDYGTRVNFSVFECPLKKGDWESLKKGVEEIIDPKEDSVLFYELCLTCIEKRVAVGIKQITPYEPVVFV